MSFVMTTRFNFCAVYSCVITDPLESVSWTGLSVDLSRSVVFRDVLGNSWVFDGCKYLFPIFTSFDIAI